MRLADGGVIRCALWGKAPRSPRERHRIADVPELANPLNQPFHSHPETRVLHAPVSAGIEVPFVGLRVLALFHEGLLDRLQVRLSFAPADDLADPVAPDHVEPEDEIGMLRVPRLVERLADPWRGRGPPHRVATTGSGRPCGRSTPLRRGWRRPRSLRA